MQNFKDVADVRDVLGDTYRSFAKGPRRHIVAADFLSLAPEEQLRRVVKQGWLMKDGTINKLVCMRGFFMIPSSTHGNHRYSGSGDGLFLSTNLGVCSTMKPIHLLHLGYEISMSDRMK